MGEKKRSLVKRDPTVTGSKNRVRYSAMGSGNQGLPTFTRQKMVCKNEFLIKALFQEQQFATVAGL